MIGGEPIEKEGTGVKTVLDDAFAYAVLSIVEEIPGGTAGGGGRGVQGCVPRGFEAVSVAVLSRMI